MLSPGLEDQNAYLNRRNAEGPKTKTLQRSEVETKYDWYRDVVEATNHLFLVILSLVLERTSPRNPRSFPAS